ncbi:MAG: hypothetical protein R2697_02280 [Ilumatobacteraceae bacterium]
MSALVDEAGEVGLDLSTLTEPERAVLEEHDEITVDGAGTPGRPRVDPFADHPLAAAVLAGGFTPDLPADADRNIIRELTRRRHPGQRNKVVFHVETIDAARVAAELLADDPAGFTVAQFRDRTGASRKVRHSHSSPNSMHEASPAAATASASKARLSPVG